MDTIKFEEVDYIYNAQTPMAHKALDKVSLTIPKGKTTAIIGHTGSGKSTLLKHLNVLLQPTHGGITILDKEVTSDSKPKGLKNLRKKVGVVFQFPEAQLFEETVLKDVMFGPLNFGLSNEEAEEIARKQLIRVGIKEELFERSPFDLSGGQMRRVAIAGVLALEPDVLVLDEPTAGLDPLGHKQIMELFMTLKEQEDLTLVLVTHQMDDVARYADKVIVLEGGKVIKQATTKEVFSNRSWLLEHHLELPQTVEFLVKLSKGTSWESKLNEGQISSALTVEELADTLAKYLPKEDKE